MSAKRYDRPIGDAVLGDYFDRLAGSLHDNALRGRFAEFLVATALGTGDWGLAWDSCDVQWNGLRVEVKTSGRGQAWPQKRPSRLSFGIEKHFSVWNAADDTWSEADVPRRWSDLYVFCVHLPFPATSEDVLDLNTWEFYVLSTSAIDEHFGDQRSVSISRIRSVAAAQTFASLRAAVIDAAKDLPPGGRR